jgi:hypothetical protein
VKALATLFAFALLPMASTAQQTGHAAWARIYAVASHPRCANCHVGGSGRPAWDGLGYNTGRLHGMNVVAGDSRIGAETIPCRTCHIGAEGPNETAHAAPQVDDAWRLPPLEMAWRGKSSAEVCTQLRNPDTNGGFSLTELVEHVRTSEFVRFGFEPGTGRDPAPGSADALARDLLDWGAAGMPCARN